MPVKLFAETITPVLGMEKCSMVLITTPPTEHCYVREIFGMKDADGNPLFREYVLTMVCQRCLRLGRITSCYHQMRRYMPSWKSVEKHDIIAVMLKDRLATFIRENYGMAYEETGSQFEKADVDRMLSDRWDPSYAAHPQLVVVACDPNASDSVNSSEMALVAATLDGQFSIVGMASHRCAHAGEMRTFLVAFLDALRADERLKNAYVAFCPENNMPGASFGLMEAMRHRPRCFPISETGVEEEAGYHTTHQSKYKWLWAAEKAVSFHRVRTLKKWICTNPHIDGGGSKDERRRVKAALKAQLSRYGDHELASGSRIVSGVVEDGKKNPALNDDLADAFCLAVCTLERLWEGLVPGFPYHLMKWGKGGDPNARKRKRAP